MKYTIYKHTLILLLSVGFLFSSCDDEWDSHYQEDTYKGAELSMMEYLEGNSELSTFTSMVKSTGYDDLLSTPQVFTVWAPNNEALTGIDLNDELVVENLVKNHITRGRKGTSNVNLDVIKMQSGKNIEFESTGDSYIFGKAELINQNQPLNNGLAHVLNGYAPYLPNIKEYIGETEGLDSLKKYIFDKDQRIWDPANSIEIEINEDGQMVYDSAFIYNNDILNWIGQLQEEDSVYTAILPTNVAWNATYDRIKGYFNMPDDLGGEEYSEEYTKNRIVESLVYWDKVENPAQYDSIIPRSAYYPGWAPNSYARTTQKIFYNVEEIFANKPTVELSNGLVYIADELPFVDSVFYKEIKLEAENSSYREQSNSTVYDRNSYGSDLDVSNQEYILVEPSSTSSNSSVTFKLNNILSASYDIYCVFVPESIAGDTLETKVSYVLTYINSATGRVRRRRVTPEDNVVKADGLTKMHALRWDFEWANVRNTDEGMELPVRLEVINQVSDAESADPDLNLTRRMRIDCILLEPVTE